MPGIGVGFAAAAAISSQVAASRRKRRQGSVRLGGPAGHPPLRCAPERHLREYALIGKRDACGGANQCRPIQCARDPEPGSRSRNAERVALFRNATALVDYAAEPDRGRKCAPAAIEQKLAQEQLPLRYVEMPVSAI